MNIYRLLKNVKSEISAEYIYFDNKRIVITTNKEAAFFDLNIVERYIDIPYFLEDTNLPVIPDIIE